MMDGFEFPELYERWRGHDLRNHYDFGNFISIRPWFYENLPPENEPEVWRFIEDEYLLRYRRILSVRFDWGSSGLWQIPFPGSVRDEFNIGDLEEMGISERGCHLLKEWCDQLDARPYDPGETDDFDYEASDERGLIAAKEVKLSLGEDMYVEFKPFREIFIVDGKAIELGVPERILGLSDTSR